MNILLNKKMIVFKINKGNKLFLNLYDYKITKKDLWIMYDIGG